MNIEGSYTFNASRPMLWSMLRNPESLAKMLPSCERLDQVNATQYEATMAIRSGPLQGVYKGVVSLSEFVNSDQMTLLLEGTGPQGPINGNGRITITPDGEQAMLHYEGAVTVNGRIAIRSPRLLQTTANSLIRQFMDALAQQVQIQTGTYTTSMEPPTEVASSPSRVSGHMTIERSELLAEIRRDQRTSYVVALLLLLMSLFFVGVIALARVMLTWLTHYFAQRMSRISQVDADNKLIEK